MKYIRQFFHWLKKWFWTEPTAKPKPLKATDVLKSQWVCVKYRDQWINLRKSEVVKWNAMSRLDRRGMARKFETMEKKGYIKFVEVNEEMTCIRNKDYNNDRD
jgi:hypothetical protein